MEYKEVMMEFSNRYEWWQITLAGFGVLYVLDKYFGISPIDKFLDREKKYNFKMFSHLHDSRLKNIIKKFNDKKFSEVEEELKNMTQSYRSFAFKSLGQYWDIKVVDEWISQDSSASLPKVIKSYILIYTAWEARWRHSIDTVSEKKLQIFKDNLQQARQLLEDLKSPHFQTNIAANLLTIYKANNVSRDTIHECFKSTEKIDKYDVELNFNYFAAISYKWWWSQEELDEYFGSLNTRSEFIQQLINAQYYFDLVHMWNHEDDNRNIEKFLLDLKKADISEDEPYRYELYVLLWWIANNLEYEQLETHFKHLALPYWKD